MSQVPFKVAVYIGRFSPPHFGHLAIINKALQKYDELLIILGSADKARDIKNPFTWQERCTMLFSTLANNSNGYKLSFSTVRDYPYNDSAWITEIQEVVRGKTKLRGDDVEISIVGSDRDDSTWYLKAFPQWNLDLSDKVHNDLSATQVRAAYFGNDLATWEQIKIHLPEQVILFLSEFKNTVEYETLKQEFDFIKGYKSSWDVAPYAPTFVTVDAAVIQSGHILLVRRRAAPGKGLWALPGGFLNQNERILSGAIRELIEETGISLVAGKNAKKITTDILRGSVSGFQVFDDPNRSLRGRTITNTFLFRLDDTKDLPNVKGADDVDAAKWVQLSTALEDPSKYFEDHYSMIQWAASNGSARF